MGNTERDDQLTLTGVVVASNKGVFKVQVNNDHFVNTKISGKLKMFEIKIIVGDEVELCVSPYDLNTGRITKRLKKA